MIDKVDLLFNPKPEQWGLRGDPFFWADLENHIRATKLPDTHKDFKKLLFDLYEQLIGVKPEGDKATYVERYNYVGMSSGMVSSKFWLEKGFPLLLERYSKSLSVDTETNRA